MRFGPEKQNRKDHKDHEEKRAPTLPEAKKRVFLRDLGKDVCRRRPLRWEQKRGLTVSVHVGVFFFVAFAVLAVHCC